MNYWLDGHTRREVICDLVLEIKTGKKARITFHMGSVAGALLEDGIRNVLTKILLNDE